VPQARHIGADILCLEGEVRRHEHLGVGHDTIQAWSASQAPDPGLTDVERNGEKDTR